jgi:MFS family permease
LKAAASEGKTSKAPIKESFGQWGNLKIVLVALLGLTAGRAVVWYTGQFYALFFLTQTLKVDSQASNLMIAASLLIGTPFFIVFGALSDRIGRKRIIMAGCALAILTYRRVDSRRRPDQGIVLLGFGSTLPKSAQCVPSSRPEQFHARIAPNNAMTLSRIDWLGPLKRA